MRMFLLQLESDLPRLSKLVGHARGRVGRSFHLVWPTLNFDLLELQLSGVQTSIHYLWKAATSLPILLVDMHHDPVWFFANMLFSKPYHYQPCGKQPWPSREVPNFCGSWCHEHLLGLHWPWTLLSRSSRLNQELVSFFRTPGFGVSILANAQGVFGMRALC